MELDVGQIPQQTSKLESDGENSLASLITPERIRLKITADKWQDVVEKAGEPLSKSGVIESSYIDSMKKIIRKFGPYAVTFPGVVLLHARPEDGVRKLCMSLITLKDSVRFGHAENDPVDIAVVIGAVDVHSHLRALRELVGLLGNEDAIKKIRSSEDVHEVWEIIRGCSDS